MKNYNVIHEEWIDVIDQSAADGSITMLELFEKSQCFVKLNFDSVREEISVMRLLLGILHTVIQRYDLDGSESFLNSRDKAIERWSRIYNNGALPFGAIKKYLLEHEDSFYLIHDTNPFMQETWMKDKEKFKIHFTDIHNIKGEVITKDSELHKNATTAIISPRKFLPSVASSNNKTRILSSRDSMSVNDTISLKKAVPALLAMHCYDDNAIKPGTGAGWMSLSTTTFIEGKNLFETLMLNLQLLDVKGNPFPKNVPSWELPPMTEPRTEPIKVPDNPAEILTAHFRSAKLLVNENDEVYGVLATAGCYFDKANVFVEPMKIWKYNEGTSNYTMHSVREAQYCWRDFPIIFQDSNKCIIPSIIWLTRLKKYGELKQQSFYNQSFFSIEYNDNKKMSVIDTVYTTLPFYWRNFDKENNIMINTMLIKEVENCIELVNITNNYLKNLCLSDAYSLSKEDNKLIKERQNKNRTIIYSIYDQIIRDFAREISISDDIFAARKDFRMKIKKATEDYGKELLGQFSNRAMYGRLQKKDKSKYEYYSAGKALNIFRAKIYKLLIGDQHE